MRAIFSSKKIRVNSGYSDRAEIGGIKFWN
jgi:hypothetical protein